MGRRAFLVGGITALGAAAMGDAAAASTGPIASGVGLPVDQFWQATDSDDTLSIVRALAAARAQGGGRVIASPNRLYRVSPSTTFVSLNPSGGTCRYRVCLKLPPGVMLDMQGSTLQLQGTDEATIVCNTNVLGSGQRDSGLGLMNSVIDGNDLPFTYHSLMHLAYIDALTLNSVKLIRGVYQGGWIYSCTSSVFDDLDADGFVGQPWTIGSPLGENQVYDSKFGRLQARNVTMFPGNSFYQPGNSFDLVLTRCDIQSIEARNCAAGIKIQWPGSDITVGSVTTDSCGDQYGNSGLKIQSDTGSGPVTRVKVGHLDARNQSGPGLFMEGCVDCSVETFVGVGNNINGNMADVWIGGTNDRIGTITSDHNGGNGVVIRPYARGYQLPQVLVQNPGTSPAPDNSAGVGVYGGVGGFGSVICVDNQFPATMSRGVDVSSPSAVGAIRSLTVSGQLEQPFRSVSASFPAPPDNTVMAPPTTSTTPPPSRWAMPSPTSTATPPSNPASPASPNPKLIHKARPRRVQRRRKRRHRPHKHRHK